jgi:hypothetical protein
MFSRDKVGGALACRANPRESCSCEIREESCVVQTHGIEVEDTSGIPIGYLQDTRKTPLGYKWVTNSRIPTGYQENTYKIPIGYQQDTRRIPIEY